MTDRLTKFNAEKGEYEYKERAKTQAEFNAQRKAVIQRLGELEDKMEQGKILELPCRVGQTVYAVSNYYGGEWRIYECCVDNFTVYKINIFMSISDREGYNFGANICEIGKTVFLTREEAEKALERSENGK